MVYGARNCAAIGNLLPAGQKYPDGDLWKIGDRWKNEQQADAGGVDGVPPTSENIASGAYPLATEVYVAVRQDTPQASTAIMFRDWLLSDDGQRVVEESGYVPLPD